MPQIQFINGLKKSFDLSVKSIKSFCEIDLTGDTNNKHFKDNRCYQ